MMMMGNMGGGSGMGMMNNMDMMNMNGGMSMGGGMSMPGMTMGGGMNMQGMNMMDPSMMGGYGYNVGLFPGLFSFAISILTVVVIVALILGAVTFIKRYVFDGNVAAR